MCCFYNKPYISAASPLIENNILFDTAQSVEYDSYGIYEDNQYREDADPASLRNNDFFGLDVLFHDEQGTGGEIISNNVILIDW